MGYGAIISHKVICFYFLFFIFFTFSIAVCQEKPKKPQTTTQPTKEVITSPKNPIKNSSEEVKNLNSKNPPKGTTYGKNGTGKLRKGDIDEHFIPLINDFTELHNNETRAADIEVDPTKFIASVRVFPSEFHCCSATFISKTVLITSAKCIYGLNPSRAFIHALSRLLEMSGISVPVKTFHTHPEFESLPPLNDIGIITLWEPLNEVKPLLLPPPMPMDLRLEDLVVYGWQFSKNRNLFYLRRTAGDHISNSRCSIILKEKLDCSTTICASNKHIIHGSFDEGLPLIHTDEDSVYIVGLYNRQGIVPHVKIDKYEKITTHLDWIKPFLKSPK